MTCASHVRVAALAEIRGPVPHAKIEGFAGDLATTPADARVDHLVTALEIAPIQQVVKPAKPTFQRGLLVAGFGAHGHAWEEER